MTIKKLLMLYVLMFFTLYAYAQKPVVLSDDVASFEIRKDYAAILEDPTNKLTIDKVSTLPDTAFSTDLPFYSTNPAFTYWIRIKIENRLEKRKKWVLEILDSRQTDVELYSSEPDGKYNVQVAGINQDFKERPYGHKNFVMDIDPDPGFEGYYYLKLKSNVVTSFLLKIRSNQEFSSYAFDEYYLLGLYYGILIIIIIYNLILFVTLRQKLYLFYVFYVLLWSWNSMLDDGLGYQYLWTSFPIVSKIGFYLGRPLLLISFTFYSRSFLELKGKYSNIDKAVTSSIVVYLLAHSVTTTIIPSFTSSILFLVPFLLIYFVSIKIFKEGYQPARFFIIGNSFIVLGILLKLVKDLGLLEFLIEFTALHIILVYSQNIGMIFEIIILSVALGDRLRFLKLKEEEAQKKIIEQLKENELLSQKVNRELETKVAERTKELIEKSEELKEANLRLKQQSEEINRWNQILDLDNYKLKREIKEVIEARIRFKDIHYEEFLKVFPDDLACQKYIEEIKWKDGFKCKKCGNEKYCKGSKKFSRRCTRCRYDESVTAYTFLHKCKFSLVKAFYIMTKVNQYGEEINFNELARTLEMRKSTVWEFKKKIIEYKNAKTGKALSEKDTLDYLILSSFK